MENFDKALSLDENYAEAVTRRGMVMINDRQHTLSQACNQFKKGEKMGDPVATEYLKEYCR